MPLLPETSSLHKWDGRFKAFQLLADAAEEYVKHLTRCNGKAALDSLHRNADKMAKELLNGEYEYTPRESADAPTERNAPV